MSGQKDFEILLELKPLETLFTELTEQKKMLYCDDLQEFDITVLREAVGNLRKKWERVTFPPVGAIVAECKSVRDKNKPSGEISGVHPWVTRQQNIDKMVFEYADNFFRTSTIAADATREGWQHYLRRFVLEVANVQAQVIYPHSGGMITLNWSLIYPNDLLAVDLYVFEKQFIADCKSIASSGVISVGIPTGKIAQWRAAYAVEQRKKA